MNEHTLVRNAASGDAASFENLILPYEKPIYNFCFRMFNNREDAQDVAQEIFLKIFRNLKKFNSRGEGSFKKWLYKVANNACIDELRKRGSRISAESLDEAVESEDGEMSRQYESKESPPDEVVISRERQSEIKKAIAGLPADYKNIIILRDIQGLSYEEIAEITGAKLGTVKSKLSRARTALRDKLIKNEIL